LLECLEARGAQHGAEPRGAHRRDCDFKHGYPVR
jgi:hypothetical protein